ncbi:MAG: ROK family protein [Pirellulaceae bacterium]|nr:ROK family protein [Pirellulaceae bacterium]
MAETTARIPLLEARRPLYLGVDVGGTGIKIGLVDDLGRTIDFTAIATDEQRGPQDAVNRIAGACRRLLDAQGLSVQDVACIGLGTPGTMDIPQGMLLDPPNLPTWSNFPIRDRLAAACHRDVFFANDAGAAAYGEYWVGSGREFGSIVMLTLGTGVGGGIIIGDLSIDGENSHGSECGHIIIDSSPAARLCSCGQRGHLEAYASATALIQRTQEALARGRDSSLAERLADGEALSGLLVSREAEAGDRLAHELVMETADYLTIGVVTLIHTIDPGAVILGGAMNFGGEKSSLGRQFLQRVRDGVRARAFPVPASRVTIRFASLGGDAGYIGAAGLARVGWNRQSRS